MKKALATALATAALTVGGLAATATPAAAIDGDSLEYYGCTTYRSTTYKRSMYCNTNAYGTQHRVSVLCQASYATSYYYMRYGAWTTQPGTSTATCSSGDYVVKLYRDFR